MQKELSGGQANELGKKLMAALTARASRKLFFSTLSRLLEEHFHFDRLCINLYDQQGEMLTYFTAAEGTIVSTLSPVRPAEVSSTVAGHVIATRKPVIITDFAQYFSESSIHPIAEAGLTATMAFPLVLDNEIIATLHCSFAEKPADIYDITNFFLEITPVVATCLGAILTLEHLRYRDAQLQAQPLFSLPTDESVICHSKKMRDVMRKIDAVAKLNIPILLLGETGTGKSLIAQTIHRCSPRKDAHFIKVNCPSLPQTLFESELFGHARGAFTGAAHKRTGRFELAHGGTLFLDEIGDLSPEMQSKLLQVLEDSSFERVGESIPLAVDARIIAATNIRVGEAIANGRLRADLFYRLALCTITLPPLRERQEDIPPLVTALAAQAATRMGLTPVNLTAAVMEPLHSHAWPGNVRELRNVVTKMVLHHAMHKELTQQAVAALLQEEQTLLAHGFPMPAAPPVVQAEDKQAGSNNRKTLEGIEREHILNVIKQTDGVLSGPKGAAALLGVPRSTLQHRMRKLGIA